MGQQDQNTFSAVYFSWSNDVKGGVCHNLSWFLCSFLFWCSTHNFDFFVINDIGGYCPLDSVQDFSSVFLFFSCFLFPHLCSIVVQVNSVLDFFLFFSPFFLSFPHAPVFHCCAGGRDISCTVFAQSEIAKDSFCACLQFPQALIVFNFIPQNTLINGQDFFFSDYNSIAQHPNFWPAGSFFCHFSLNPICWLIAVRVRTKIAIFWKSFSNICHTSDNNSTPSRLRRIRFWCLEISVKS